MLILLIALSVWLVLSAGTILWLARRLRLERNRAEGLGSNLNQTEAQLRRISQAVESASDAIGIGDCEGHSLYHNRAHLAMFGYTVDELNAVPGSGALFAEAATAREIHASIREGKSWVGEVDVKTKDGRKIPAHVRADLILDEQSKPVGIFGVFTDITARQQAARALEDESRRLAITLQSIADGVITTDERGRIDLMNRVAEQLTGWRQEEARRLPLNLVLPLHADGFEENYNPIESPSSPRLSAIPPPTICVLRTRRGEERIIAEQTTPLGGGDRQVAGHVVVFRDITLERERATERERADRLESLGLLAGGIAHDFANLLTAILGHVSLARSLPELSPRAENILEQAETASWRARDVTQQLLTFASGGPLEKKPVDVPQLVRESVALVVTEFPTMQTRFHFAPQLVSVDADSIQLGQVFHNLALNAAQAMDRGGSLLVKIHEAPLPPADATKPSAPMACVSFSDTGKGIAPENLSRIFDPFFTTRKKGTGLGLATVYSIVKHHGGDLKVESTLGFGSTFRVFLPLPTNAIDSPVQSE